MLFDICILKGWVLNDRCLCIHGWHQCLSIDHRSFRDGESDCKEECHQHTLKSLIPQIVIPGTHSWCRSEITKDLRRILVVHLTTLDLFRSCTINNDVLPVTQIRWRTCCSSLMSYFIQKWEVGTLSKAFLKSKKVRQTSVPYSKNWRMSWKVDNSAVMVEIKFLSASVEIQGYTYVSPVTCWWQGKERWVCNCEDHQH